MRRAQSVGSPVPVDACARLCLDIIPYQRSRPYLPDSGLAAVVRSGLDRPLRPILGVRDGDDQERCDQTLVRPELTGHGDPRGGALIATSAAPTDRYGPLFLALIGTLLISPFFSGGPVQKAALVVIVGLVVIASFRATGIRSKKALFTTVAAGAILLVPAAFSKGNVVQTIVLTVLAIGMALGPPNIVRRVLEHERVRLQQVIAALCAYLQIGFAFAFGFAAVDGVSTAQVLGEAGGSRFFDYVYFSFVTMTTVGYGDITATTDMARALAIVETLLGQIFLVVLVAYLVGTLSGSRTRRSSQDDEPRA